MQDSCNDFKDRNKSTEVFLSEVASMQWEAYTMLELRVKLITR